MSRIVAIVGRPNVGKSTLFNRLIESKEAIVDELSGVTRDRHYGKSVWNGVAFSVIDTGGYAETEDDPFSFEINKQVRLAVEEADVILLLTDVTVGIHEFDQTMAGLLRKSPKKVILVVNKVDNSQRLNDATEFYSLGIGDYFAISSINGSGTGELLDEVVKHLDGSAEEEYDEIPRVAIVGRPNVGKSSLVNALLGEERFIVTPVAGTTRDSIFTRYNKFNYEFYLIDTAGLRKRGKVKEDLEFYTVLRSVRAIESADVCVLLIDGTRGLESQDLSILSVILRNSKGVVIAVNKWDLLEKESNTALQFEKLLKERTAPFVDYPVLFISALHKQRVHKLLETIQEVYNNRTTKISTSELNTVMLEAIKVSPPPALKGKLIKIKYVTQLPTRIPSFAFFCNHPQYIKDPYKRYLENRLREKFKFTGVPINIFMRKK